MSVSVRPLLLTAALCGLLAALAGPAAARSPLRCGNVRVDQVLHTDPKGLFGAFRIRALGTPCPGAVRVASTYVHDPSAVEHHSTRVRGWSCSWRGAGVAQQVLVSCRRRAGRISFVDKIPSG